MTFDDFFTLTEKNNGLTAPSRVRELIDVMQNEEDSDVKNVGESTRQWSAVANAIGATDNKDCIDLFIQLDGLKFLDKWLKEAQRFSNNTSDSFLEESITQLLHVLEKLPADHEKLVASGIWATIEDLLLHSSSKVQDKARELHQIWKRNAGSDAPLTDVGNIGALSNHEMGSTENIEKGRVHPEGPASLSREGSVQPKNQESAGDDPLHVTSSVTANSLNKSSEPPVRDERLSDQVGSPSSANCDIKPPVSDSIATASVESCHPAVSSQEAPELAADCHMAESPSNMNQTTKSGDSANMDISPEEFKKSQDKPLSLCSDTTDAMKSENKSTSPLHSNTVDKNSWGVGSLSINSRETDSEGKTAMVDNGYLNQSRSSNTFNATTGGDYMHQMLRRSSSNEKTLTNPIDLGRLLSGIDDVKINRHLKKGGSDLANNYNFAKNETDRGSHRIAISSDELDYGIIDPLDFARQVANEVEREVVDYKEHSCSSSEKVPGGNVQKLHSPDTVNSKQTCGSEGLVKEVGNNSVSSGEEASAMQEDSATSSETIDAEQANVSPDVGSSQITEAAQTDVQLEKEVGNFDLNLEICSEENDHAANQILAPVSVVSASRATAAPLQPPAPLQFEGNLGWKGSAATSAFRPASPRRVVESEKDLSVGGSSSSSKQRQVCLDFDLNVAESVEGESSVATNSRKYEHLELDLNNASEDLGPSDWRISQFFPQGNGHQTRTHSCSSSSTQPSLRSFDLNGQPSFLNDSSEHSYLSKLSQNQNHPGGIRSDDSVISIMGTKVQVKGKDIVSEMQPLLNGRTPELAFDLNLGRSGNFLGMGSMVPYTHSPLYGYNNTGPSPGLGHASPMPFPSTLYGPGGPIPYMVDSRGAHVIPQLGGPVSAIPQALTQPPFLINMASSSPSNGVGPSRSNFDLNSGMMMESGSGDPPVGFRQFLSSGHVRSMEEQMRSNAHAHAQPTISSVGGKRKEPENGWENYPLRHYNTPPWK